MVESATFRTARMRAAAEAGFSTATDLADWLVREAGLPFREAHHVTGRAVKRAEELGIALDALSIDASFLTTAHYDQLGEAVEDGVSLWLGVLPTDRAPSLDAARERLHAIWSELGFNREHLADAVVPTPACGLAGASPQQVRRILAVLRDVGASLRDEA